MRANASIASRSAASEAGVASPRPVAWIAALNAGTFCDDGGLLGIAGRGGRGGKQRDQRIADRFRRVDAGHQPTLGGARVVLVQRRDERGELRNVVGIEARVAPEPAADQRQCLLKVVRRSFGRDRIPDAARDVLRRQVEPRPRERAGMGELDRPRRGDHRGAKARPVGHRISTPDARPKRDSVSLRGLPASCRASRAGGRPLRARPSARGAAAPVPRGRCRTSAPWGRARVSSSLTWCFTYSLSTFTPASYSGSLGRRGLEPADDVLERLVLDRGLVHEILHARPRAAARPG